MVRNVHLTEQLGTKFPQFFLTVPAPCPYLSGKLERKVFTQLHGDLSIPLNDALTNAGFRRSQNIAYKPACEDCQACQSVRIRADEFEWTKSWKRIVKRNASIIASINPAVATEEQFSVLRGYLDSRHADGGIGLRDGIHGGRHHGDVQVDIAGQPRGERDVGCDDL